MKVLQNLFIYDFEKLTSVCNKLGIFGKIVHLMCHMEKSVDIARLNF